MKKKQYIGEDSMNRKGKWKYESEDGILIKRTKLDEPDKGIEQYLIVYHGGYVGKCIHWVDMERYDEIYNHNGNGWRQHIQNNNIYN
jgi:hypothetical protein